MRPVLMRAFLVAGALAAAHTGLWWWATGRLLAQAEAMEAGLRAQGWVVTAGPPSRGGWPWRAAVLVPGVVVADGALVWEAGPVTLGSPLWRVGRVDLAFAGERVVRLGTVSLTVRAEGVALASGFLTARTLTVGTLALHAVSARPAEGAVRVTAQELAGSLRAGWRDGRLALEAVAVRWGPLAVDGSAALGWEGGRLAGGGVVRLSGWAAAVDAAVRDGVLTRNQGRVLGLELGLLARQDGSGVAELPVTLSDQAITIGAIPVLRLP